MRIWKAVAKAVLTFSVVKAMGWDGILLWTNWEKMPESSKVTEIASVIIEIIALAAITAV